MRAIVAHRYGDPDVLQLEERPEPTLAPEDLLIEVHATSVTTAEWRIRAADFGAGFSLLGRLMFGLFKPRQPTTGREFAGRVRAVGTAVRDFQVGDDVFGTHPGANVELLAMPQSAIVTRMPEGLSYAEAVALPFGGITALHFLEDAAKVRPGERVLVIGASGGVGSAVVQVAVGLGAQVTGVCSQSNAALVRELGAREVVDYRVTEPHTLRGPFDVIVDTVGKTRFAAFKPMLSATGRHVFIEGGLREMFQALLPRFGQGPRVVGGVAEDTRAAFERLRDRVEAGVLRPVIGHRFPMAQAIEAHRLVQTRHKRGAVVLDFPVAMRAAS